MFTRKKECEIDLIFRRLCKWEDLIVASGIGIDSLQHELVRDFLAIQHTYDKDGWGNWCEWDDEALQILHRFLNFNSKHTARIQQGAADGGYVTSSMHVIATEVLRWLSSQKYFQYNPNSNFTWLDVPFETLEDSGDSVPRPPSIPNS